MNKSVWIGIATAIGLGEYYRYGRMMDSVSVKASNVKFSAQGTLMSISFSLEINNKSNKSVNIRSLNGKLYVGKLFIGKVNYKVCIIYKPLVELLSPRSHRRLGPGSSLLTARLGRFPRTTPTFSDVLHNLFG